ncbi:MAG TPA: hypothetical protein ENJ95_15835 [Bacteroidetes bacterium]|nr:hypothetical protein [Bacteroidota bacterium]
MDLKAKELLPDIRGLFERDLVDTFICGDYEAVSSDLINPKYNLNYKREVHQSIFDRYTDILTTWAGYQPQPDPAPQEEWPAPAEPPAAKLPPDLAPAKPKLPRKVGRNEPCICGSGKKFKRCCIDKYQ